ncbi:SDR family NAD(P)-dependent oxidoreductase [Paenibacillus brasilensis]|nr:SDR family NAD(P)-dependent oxidoreductase [Paenibacillus brasilensis]
MEQKKGPENTSYVSRIFEVCNKYPDKKLFIYQDKNEFPNFLDGQTLINKIRTVGSALQSKMVPAEKAILILPQGLEYIYSIMACWYANVVAIPAPITDPVVKAQDLEKLSLILKDSQASCIITNTYFMGVLKENPNFSSLFMLNVDDTAWDGFTITEEKSHNPGDLALLIYTSGSTSQPKGVMISHKNLMFQAGADQWRIDQDTRMVSWLPQFHAFGLHNNILVPLLHGASSVILSPSRFIKNPEAWLEAIDRYQATHTAVPNFAFEYCCSSIDLDSVKNLSLASIKAIICAGEPIREEAYQSFNMKFKSIGLRENVFCPLLGLSEVCPVVSIKPGEPVRYLNLDVDCLDQGKVKYSDNPGKSRSVSSCGEIEKPTKIVIANPETRVSCSPGEIGEVWIKSDGVGLGYFNREQETEQSFSAILDDTKEDGFFRTGDIGFIEDNHLYIIGREKEVMVIRGKKHHPIDLEWTVKKNLPELAASIAIFSCEIGQEERVVVVQELEAPVSESECKKIVKDIIRVVTETHGVEIYEIDLVQSGSIPKSGSGKVQKKACRNLYLNHELIVIHKYVRGIHTAPIKVQEVSAVKTDEMIEALKKKVFLPILDLDPAALEETTVLFELGMNSVQYVQISRKIEEIFNIQFETVRLFEHVDFEDLAKYILTQIDGLPVRETSEAQAIAQVRASSDSPVAVSENTNQGDIAIIGVCCDFPGGSVDLEHFWDNIIGNSDCITPIEQSRPGILKDFEAYYGDLEDSFPQWGGFIKDVEMFDAPFFHISPLEAESMDPQQRKCLEFTWTVIEDGGYNPARLAGQDVGVFIGVHYNDYAELVLRQPELMETYGAYLDSGLHMSMIANRVSRWFNFHGPSEVVNTACSSSLVAVHHAAEAIHKGECSLAVAGGINLILTSRVYRACHKGRMLAKDGRCKTFDEQADGFVRAEGYGAVLLKAYDQAVEDKDTIYGIIKRTVINHDGHSGSLRAPNLNAQKELIKAAYKDSDVPPETVSYIETHGTGTSLGDPIEVQAIQEAFKEVNPHIPNSYCGVGSVKTNIGHLESASGIAGLIKVLLSMNKGMLPGIVHFNKLNPYIPLSMSPLYIVDRVKEWKRLTNSDGQEIARRAGISSFGFGGANAHVVVEEYIPHHKVEGAAAGLTQGKAAIIPLSARNKQQLNAYALRLLKFLMKFNTEIHLEDLAYTFQVGREAMEERVSFVADNIQGLIEQLKDFTEGKDQIQNCYGVAPDEDSQEKEFAELWAKGLSMDWNQLYGEIKPRRMNVPTYPFAKERYWIPEAEVKRGSQITPVPGAFIHPLLHQNTSDLSEQRFSSAFTGEEFFLSDHIINGQKILPGVAYIEMVREAARQATGASEESHNRIRIKNMVWAQPVVAVSSPVKVDISLFPEENGEIGYEIYSNISNDDPGYSVNSQGSIVLSPAVHPQMLDIGALKAMCSENRFSAGQCYEAYRELGIDYGLGHQGIEALYVGEGKVLAKLSLPACVMDTKDQFVIHPSVMDSALQASIGLTLLSGDRKAVLPFALDEVEVFERCRPNMWGYIRHIGSKTPEKKVQKLDIDLLDEDGKVCVRIKGLSLRVLEDQAYGEAPAETHMLELYWKEQPIEPEGLKIKYAQHVVVLCEPEEAILHTVQAGMDQAQLIVLHSEDQAIDQRFEAYTVRLFEEIQRILKAKHTSRVLIQVVISFNNEQMLLSGLSGLLKTAQLENPKISCKLIEIEAWDKPEELVKQMTENSRGSFDNPIRYLNGKRWAVDLKELDTVNDEVHIPWKDNGTYLITGGAGGIGLIFAEEIAQRVQGANLILTGRSPLRADKAAQLAKLRESGAFIEYRQADITQKDAVAGLIRSIQDKFGNINGIIHSAGVIRDNFIIKKTKEELKEVLAPKVTGLFNIDQASKDIDMDFLILFSSVADLMGNLGQADYAAANAFMDAYAKYRNQLVAAEQRSGQTLSILWPLWKDGGMKVDQESEKIMLERMGLAPMHTAAGIRMLYQGLASGRDQLVVMHGDLNRLRAALRGNNIRAGASEASNAGEQQIENRGNLGSVAKEKAVNYFKTVLSSVLRLPASRIEADAKMEKYGIDSIMIMQLTNELEKTFGSLSKTLFFEYQSIQELTDYFLESYADKMAELLEINGNTENSGSKPSETTRLETVTKTSETTLRSRRHQRFANIHTESPQATTTDALDIAIIGVSGRYPGARTVQEFWEVLRDGKDCITEIPKDRWDHRLFFDEDKNKPGKTYSKWGGFIEDVDKFDPLFFNISPRDAEMMDPQERLFLECVYESLEDAGYTREALHAAADSGLKGNVGVYVGAMYEEYQLYGVQETLQGRPIALSGNISSIANRISYFFNFQGPSMAVDTMCSSSLTAIHLACQSLQTGGCELAIAGGVNVSIHPNKYLALAQGKFASSKGRCESFGQGGDGYVPGEGVGAVILRPLSKAIEAGDHIYGVIKGTAINHGGKTNGYTVPNPNAQAAVVNQAYKKAGIDPSTISYIEAHGTGTSLGDPIEISGLSKAFREYTDNTQFCAIGSLKSNIGHCESAAGIAGITKVLLQLKFQKLAPSLHSKTLNPNIDFIHTPFVVQQELADWEHPVINGKEIPRRAGISSFGAGGANAHIIVEEYIEQNRQETLITQPVIIVLSAKNEEQLTKRVQQLLAVIGEQQFTNDDLTSIAYTLQVGREAMEERMAVIAGSVHELQSKLRAFIENQNEVEAVYKGQIKRNKAALSIFAADEELQEAMDKWVQRKKYERIAELWVNGVDFDWNKLYAAVRPKRISLPTYPFARERYWMPTVKPVPGGIQDPVASEAAPSAYTENMVLVKDWSPQSAEPHRDASEGIIIVAGTSATEELAFTLFKDHRDIRIVQVIHGGNPYLRGITTDFYSGSAGERLYQQVKEAIPDQRILGVIDISALDSEYERSLDVELGKIKFLQQIIENHRNDHCKFLQITYNLNDLDTKITTMNGSRLAGFYRMLSAEYSQIQSMTMDTDCSIQENHRLALQIQMEFLNKNTENVTECCYRNDKRYMPVLKSHPVEDAAWERVNATAKVEDQHVVVVTGGSRGIGAAVARHIASQGVKNLVIMGREELPEPSRWKAVLESQEKSELKEKLKAMQYLMDQGIKVLYDHTSLTNLEGLRLLLRKVHRDLGPVTGVFHCAGLASNNPAFYKKELSDIAAVCEPKIKGLVTLHQAVENEPLKFFVLFSSISGVVPALAAGQSDYAAANAYMDYYVLNQHGEGKAYFQSIQWPAWSETGMASGVMRTPAYTRTGISALGTADGIRFLDYLQSSPYPVSIPCKADSSTFASGLMLKAEIKSAKEEDRLPQHDRKGKSESPPTGGIGGLRAPVVKWLRSVLASELKLKEDQLNEDKPFSDYGVESITLAQLTQAMQQKVDKPITPSLLLEHSTIAALADYFVSNHSEALQNSLGETRITPNIAYSQTETSEADTGIKSPFVTDQANTTEDIAVIGISCRFPDSPTKEDYWNLLAQGKCAIRPLTDRRWQSEDSPVYYGGWIQDAERFDPKFFNINEHDAAIMDVQARIILEESLKAVYDAGYDHKQLSGHKTGVYIGGRSQPVADLETVLEAPNPILGIGQNYIAANISKFFNFKGPSMIVDTACSSGISGLILAADALRAKRMDMALVGAVSVQTDSLAHDMLAARNILSKNGEFHIFDKQSEGEVLGEGAGVVLLKRLDDAIRDGNHVYGVIKAISVNNDGKTLGPGSPNILTQKQVMQDALELSGVQAGDIGYIEVNGGGSPVVDSIEIKAVSEVYSLNRRDLPLCCIGSVKPNIGHLLLASGLAGFIRCVLSVHHKKIPPFLSALTPFDYYDFSASRICFNRETIDWRADAGKKRIAALNSFPDGGTNCHVIIEEFVPHADYRQYLFPKTAPTMDKKYFPISNGRTSLKELVIAGKPQDASQRKERNITNVWGDYYE